MTKSKVMSKNEKMTKSEQQFLSKMKEYYLSKDHKLWSKGLASLEDEIGFTDIESQTFDQAYERALYFLTDGGKKERPTNEKLGKVIQAMLATDDEIDELSK